MEETPASRDCQEKTSICVESTRDLIFMTRSFTVPIQDAEERDRQISNPEKRNRSSRSASASVIPSPMDPVGRSACGPSRDGHEAGTAGLINGTLCHLIQEMKSFKLHLCATRTACHGAGSAIVDDYWPRLCGWSDVHSIACTPTRKVAGGCGHSSQI